MHETNQPINAKTIEAYLSAIDGFEYEHNLGVGEKVEIYLPPNAHSEASCKIYHSSKTETWIAEFDDDLGNVAIESWANLADVVEAFQP